MRKLASTYTFSFGIAAAMLAACGGSPSVRTLYPSSDTVSHQQTFQYTGRAQRFKVPAGVTTLDVVARGAEGGGASGCGSAGCFFEGGIGGRVHAQIPVKAGETLYVYVGGSASGLSSSGGFNGGGKGGSSGVSITAYAGGGASDVREGGDTLQDRILVAAGGGGQGSGWISYFYGYGGKGGGLVGGSGNSTEKANGGTGGSQTQGGSGGAGTGPGGQSGGNGSLGAGGNGGNGDDNGYTNGGAGGGAGAGYYGGGGGGGIGSAGSTGPGGGGGGGSSYIEPAATKGRTWSGWKPGWEKLKGNGLVVFSW